MRKIILILSVLTTVSLSLFAQITSTSQWTWMKGDNILDVNGVYGTQGNPAAANKPGGRQHSCSWTDASGKMWLFGGYGYPTGTGYSDMLNDLWQYDPATNQWAWMKGAKTAYNSGTYGTQGTAANTNTPGSRENPVTWADASGNLWLFGGNGLDATGYWDVLNDLWKYNIATGKWTWMKGSNSAGGSGVYGTMGVAAAANVPGARSGSLTWVDASGNFWLFGGYGYDDGTNFYSDELNDLWKYNPTTNQWTWISGDNISAAYGVYGTKGVADPSNKPGGREQGASWIDNSGNLWLFGGLGYDDGTVGFYADYLNDLWKFDPTSGQWTWMHGNSDVLSPAGVYGTQGVADPANIPGSRTQITYWKDALGKFWVFGGEGYDASGYEEDLNDLFEYDPSTNQWAWIKGDNTAALGAVYGTQGIQAAANKPGARDEMRVSWVDASGNLWLFGGDGYITTGGFEGYLNDLWKLSPVVLPVTISNIKAYERNTGINVEWTFSQEIDMDRYEVEKSTAGVNFNRTGTVVSSGNHSNTISYSWFDANPNPGANFYRVKMIGKNGQITYTQIVKVVIGRGGDITIYPNPTINNSFALQLNVQPKGNYDIRIINTVGQTVFKSVIAHAGGSRTETIQLPQSMSKGIYNLEVISTDGRLSVIKLVVGK
jgi:N-acetylneuraminic acid mutarotase